MCVCSCVEVKGHRLVAVTHSLTCHELLSLCHAIQEDKNDSTEENHRNQDSGEDFGPDRRRRTFCKEHKEAEHHPVRPLTSDHVLLFDLLAERC